MKNLFSGRDRRLMEQLARNLKLLVARDLRALNPKKTKTLSTRQLATASNLDDGRRLYFSLLGIPSRVSQYALFLVSVIEKQLSF